MLSTLNGSKQIELEEAGLNAWPALEQVMCDGWVLRAAAGYTRRANSVQPLYPGCRSLYQKILDVERWYRHRQFNPTFRLTDASHPSNLDSVLEDRGYRKEAPTSVQVVSLEDLAPESAEGKCAIWTALNPEWFDAYRSIQETPCEDTGTLSSILERGGESRWFATIYDGDEPMSVGLAVGEGRWVGLFGLATRPDRRRQGLSRRLIGSLLQSARAAGADRTYLQVEVTNDPALGLYARLGFREVYRYWYRTGGGRTG